MLGLSEKIEHLLSQIQDNIFQKALQFRDENIIHVDTYEEFKKAISGKGGFVAAHWDGTSETEEKIKQETKATIRCIPLNNKQEEGKCIFSGKLSKERVLFAVAY
jgi:prolyl-tRNA synthetase